MANLGALSLRSLVEQDRTAAHAEVDRKFNLLLQAVSDAYDVGNIAPSKPKRTRTRKAANENAAATTSDTSDTIPPPATTPTEDRDAFRDACVSVNTVLVEAGKEGLAMSAIVEGTKLTESVARDCVKDMVSRGTVVKFGNRRGTRYASSTANAPNG